MRTTNLVSLLLLNRRVHCELVFGNTVKCELPDLLLNCCCNITSFNLNGKIYRPCFNLNNTNTNHSLLWRQHFQTFLSSHSLLFHAQREYRKRCRKYELKCTDKWHDNLPLSVAENREVRITWDMTIYIDKRLKQNRPDITAVHKETQEWTLIDIAVQADQNILTTDEEKVDRY